MSIARDGFALVALLLFAPVAQAQNAAQTFIGTTPADPVILRMLGLPANAEAELIEWKLTLHGSAQNPARYELHVDYGMTMQNHPGIARAKKSLDRQGAASVSKGRKSDSAATVVALDGLALTKVGDNLLHFLDADRALMVGNGGWSFTLGNAAHADKGDDTAPPPDMSYTNVSAVGGSVFDAFEGRTPCQAIARELNIAVPSGCLRLKWGIRFFRDPATGNPTTYAIGGMLFRQGPRSGTWTIARGRDPGTVIYRLSANGTERQLSFLKGDDDVLFMLDRNDSPLVGDASFAYTLDRKKR